MLYFLHIPKTAGSTMNYIIKKNYGSKAQEIRWHWTAWLAKEKVKEKLESLKEPDIELIHGHFVYGAHALRHQPQFKYFTFVREPLAKAISGFQHVRRDKKATFHGSYKTGELAGYLLDDRILENDNGLVRRISGFGDEVPYGSINQTHLDKAIQNIDDHFLGVGITERFDLSVTWFKSMGIFKSVYYWKQNSARSKARDTVSEEVLDRFRELNKWDVSLYSHCLSRFDSSTRNVSFSQNRFETGNRIYNMLLLPQKAMSKVIRKLGIGRSPVNKLGN
jgi:hypothetical protein